MMNKVLMIITFLSTCFMVAESRDLQDLLQAGNQYYLDGEYEMAVQAYQSIIDSGYTSAELYYNLGNAYYKSHDITMALVNYERARILKPNDPEIQHNLAIAREFVVDRIEVLPEFFLRKAYVGFVKIFDADIWALVSVVTFGLALGLFLAYFFMKRLFFRKISFWTGVLFIIMAAANFLFALQQNNLVTKHNQAIILTPSVTIKSSPDEDSGTDLFLLHEGTKVTISDELGDWREVVLSDGNSGWLKESDLIRL
jgi:tetratricopeptide (TPR) repeat protein